jgi:hypothetical protein
LSVLSGLESHPVVVLSMSRSYRRGNNERKGKSEGREETAQSFRTP